MKTMQPLYRDRDWLYKHYIILQESMTFIAQETGCIHTTIWSWLHGFDIPARTCGEGIFLAKRNFLDLSNRLSNLLEGKLLGDGCIQMHGSRSAKYSHSSKYESYLVWLSKEFSNLGIEQVGKINKYWDEEYETFGYMYQSRSYPELVPLRQSWYPNGKKIVPEDLSLNPLMARQWFIGDGCLETTKKRPDIRFYTYAFDKASINHLLAELRGKGFKVSYWPSCNSIGMSVHSVRDFLDWIGPCPTEIESIYEYKWEA